MSKRKTIHLTGAEVQSGLNRVGLAELLILQLPADHDGRNTWLLNYGVREEALERRKKRGINWNSITQAAPTIRSNAGGML